MAILDPYDDEEDEYEDYEPYQPKTFIAVETVGECEKETNGVKRDAKLEYGFDENLEFGFRYTESTSFDLYLIPADDSNNEGTLTYKAED